MAINDFTLETAQPSTLTYIEGVNGGLLIGDYINNSTTSPAGSAYNTPVPSTINGVNVSAILELQSTTGALLIPRMTSAQRDNLTSIANGMIIYNTSLSVFQFYQGSTWVSLSSGAAGDVTGPGSSTNTALARWNGTTGELLSDSTILLDDSGNITGANSLAFSSSTFNIDNGGDLNNVLSASFVSGFTIDNSGNLDEFPQAFANSGSTEFSPAYTFTSDYHTGMYQDTSNTLSFSSNEKQVLRLLGASTSAINALTITNATTTNPPTIGIASTSDTNVSIKFLPKGAGQLLAPVGAVATPSYSFTGETNIGMWSSAANTIDFSTNSLRALKILSSIASAVNFLTIQSTATGNGPILAAAGNDTNVDLNLIPKGTGHLRCGVLGTATSPGFAGPGSNAGGLSWTSSRQLSLLVAGATAFIVASNASPPNPGTIVNAIAVYGNTTTAENQAWCPYFYPSGADVGNNNIDIGFQASYAISIGGNPAGIALLADDTGTYGGSVKFWNNSNTFYTQLLANNSNSNNVVLTLPSSDATTAKAPLTSDASGNLSFANNAALTSGTSSWGGGGTSNTFTATGVTSSSQVVVSISAQANSAYIKSYTVGTNTIAVTFSADPGAGTAITWMATAGAA